MKISKGTATLVAALLAAGATFGVGTVAASATVVPCIPSDGSAAYDEIITEGYDEIVVDSAAGWQRYSWTGGSIADGVTPSFPDANWQANTASDPHGVGVAGAYFRSHGGSGGGDWFYLEAIPEKTHLVHHDAVVVHHDAVPPVTCGGDLQKEIALYCYEKLNPESPAAWENSGLQTLAATKLGDVDWTNAEKRELCNAPEETCDPGAIASQSDWGNVLESFEWPETILYPTDNIGWPPIYNAVHTDLTQVEPEEGCETETWEICPTVGNYETATNENPNGWAIKPGRGEFIEGGLSLQSTDSSSAWAQKTLNIPFKGLGDLSTNYSDKTDQYTFGVILTIDGPQPDHAFGKQQIHYDEDGRYWTDIPGVFPESTLKGGYYETYDLVADLLQPNLNIVNIVLYVNAGHGGLVIHSQNFGCSSQPFDYENHFVGIPTQYSADPIGPDCLTAGSLGDIAPGVFDHVNVTVTDNGDGTYLVEAETDEGYFFSDETTYKSRVVEVFGATGFQNENPEAPCFQLVVAEPGVPTFNDACGTANDTVTPPEDTEFVTYSVVDARDENGVGRVTVLAELVNEEDTFPEGAITEWTFDFTNVACPTTVVDVPPSLVVTGTDALLPFGLAGGALVLGLGTLLFARKRKPVVED